MTTTSRPASRAMAAAKKPVAAADSSLLGLGTQLRFYVRSIGWAPKTIRRYKKEVLRLLAEVALGSGALSVVGGTVGVIAFLAFFTGTEVGLQGFTAQLGAMRISEEVDALEVMGVPSLPYLVTTRMIAGFVAVIPLYVIGLLSSYSATRLIATGYYGQSKGTYDHYFNLFLPPGDVLWSFFKVMIFAIVIILIHCYYGYTASGGPAGVGVAVGRAVRASIVAINVVDFFLSLAIWGTSTTVRIAG